MRYPDLAQLPPPPNGRDGWPWTDEMTVQSKWTLADSPWPRISIVTPSFNQGEFIEETIRSVLLQKYQNLEYIIFDGGSSDDSIDIISKYEPWVTYWISEPDRGQTHAINKGFSRSTGDIIAWLNSDDMYASGALRHVGYLFETRPEIDVLVGACGYLEKDGTPLNHVKRVTELDLNSYLYRWKTLPQPSIFWRRKMWEDIGALDERLHFALDTEYILRMWFSKVQFYFSPQTVLGLERWHEQQKTRSRTQLRQEQVRVVDYYFREYLGGTLANAVRLIAHNRNYVRKRSGFRGLVSSFPNGQESALLNYLLHERRKSPLFEPAWQRSDQ